VPTVEIVRELTEELVDAFARLIPQLSSSALPVGRQELAAVLANPCTYLMIARDEAGEINGTLTLVTFRIPTGTRAWIEDVVVDESVRGRGVGEALSRAAVDIASDLGARTVELTSRPSREVANRLYQRLGFELRDTNVYRYRVPAVEPSRLLEMEGAINFRDLGGYKGHEGRLVKWRKLFRSDSLHRLSASDERQLVGLGLKTVFDLRTLAEIEQRGRVPELAELAYHHLPLIDVLPPVRTGEVVIRPGEMAVGYMDMVREGWRSVASVLLTLSETESYPAVFHCAIGKDRTGIVAAVVLGVLGVSDDDIVADYALSRAGMTRALAEVAAERTPEDYARIAPLFGAEPETMREFLREFRAHYHSFEGFASDIGLPDAPGRLRSILLEP
jgi:protein-tyrosine phosphatase